MYLFQISCDTFGQSEIAPTEEDFRRMMSDPWYKCFKYENNRFFKITKDKEEVLISDSPGCLFIGEDGNATVESVTEEAVEDVEVGVLQIIKFDKKFYRMDEEGDWVKVPKMDIGDCSFGQYHIL